MAKHETADIAREMVGACLMSRSRQVARQLTSMYDDGLRPFGIQASQLLLLATVAYAGPVRRSDISGALDYDASTLTRNFRVMEGNGWIEEVRDASDRRGRPVRITASGRALLAKAAPAWQKAQVKAARLLGEDGAAVLLRLTPVPR